MHLPKVTTTASAVPVGGSESIASPKGENALQAMLSTSGGNNSPWRYLADELREYAQNGNGGLSHGELRDHDTAIDEKMTDRLDGIWSQSLLMQQATLNLGNVKSHMPDAALQAAIVAGLAAGNFAGEEAGGGRMHNGANDMSALALAMESEDVRPGQLTPGFKIDKPLDQDALAADARRVQEAADARRVQEAANRASEGSTLADKAANEVRKSAAQSDGVAHLNALQGREQGGEMAMAGTSRWDSIGTRELQFGNVASFGEQLHAALAKRIEHQAGNGLNQVTIRLDPPELGAIRLMVQCLADGALEVRLHASNAEVARQLQQFSDRLQSDLLRNAFSQVSVQVSTGQQQGGQERGRQGQSLAQESSTILGANQTDLGTGQDLRSQEYWLTRV